MDELKAKELVVRAGLELIENGLIARTWGNVSCRINDETFAITPSGRAYESLTPDDIVICRTEDASYDGDIKPSSEKGIHALIYRKRPDAGFIIHTHQTQASAASILDKSCIPAGFSSQGELVPIAEYGLPGTKKLCKGVENALAETSGKAVIMSHHGAVCFGKDDCEAFDVALALETGSRKFIDKLFREKKEKNPSGRNPFYSLFSEDTSEYTENLSRLGSSRRTNNGFRLFIDGRDTIYRIDQSDMPIEAAVHAEIYRRRGDINHISFGGSAPLAAISNEKAPLVAVLDDFAQIEGRRADCAASVLPKSIADALGKRSGVLVPGCGALCCGTTESDSNAVLLVMEKNAYAQAAASLTGKSREISLADCALMRAVYKLSYSKKE